MNHAANNINNLPVKMVCVLLILSNTLQTFKYMKHISREIVVLC